MEGEDGGRGEGRGERGEGRGKRGEGRGRKGEERHEGTEGALVGLTGHFGAQLNLTDPRVQPRRSPLSLLPSRSTSFHPLANLHSLSFLVCPKANPKPGTLPLASIRKTSPPLFFLTLFSILIRFTFHSLHPTLILLSNRLNAPSFFASDILPNKLVLHTYSQSIRRGRPKWLDPASSGHSRQSFFYALARTRLSLLFLGLHVSRFSSPTEMLSLLLRVLSSSRFQRRQVCCRVVPVSWRRRLSFPIHSTAMPL